MPKKITEHGPDATSTTDGIFDVCSPPGGAPETDHLSCPPDSSGASEASDEDWEPGGSECESQCHGTICVRARRAVTGPRSVRRFPITYSSAFRARPIAKMATAHQTGQGRMMCRRSLQQESPTKHHVQQGLSTAAAGHAASQTLAGRSNYAVPSQIHKVDGAIDLTAEQVEGSKMPAASDGPSLRRV